MRPKPTESLSCEHEPNRCAEDCGNHGRRDRLQAGALLRPRRSDPPSFSPVNIRKLLVASGEALCWESNELARDSSFYIVHA